MAAFILVIGDGALGGADQIGQVILRQSARLPDLNQLLAKVPI